MKTIAVILVMLNIPCERWENNNVTLTDSATQENEFIELHVGKVEFHAVWMEPRERCALTFETNDEALEYVRTNYVGEEFALIDLKSATTRVLRQLSDGYETVRREVVKHEPRYKVEEVRNEP